MKKFTEYKQEDFLADASFREWVRREVPHDLDDFWTQWLADHPRQRAEAQRAREVLLAGGVSEKKITDTQVEALVQRTIQAIRQAESPVVPLLTRRAAWYWTAAASVVLAVLLSWYAFRPMSVRPEQVATRQAEPSEPQLLTRRNTTPHQLPVNLPDGSTVLLSPASQVSYPAVFPDERREVQLIGQAFFEVTKNPAQPFFVYAGDVVARVVGTSFTIKAPPGASKINVIVKTGEVAVYQRSQGKDQAELAQARPLTLRPNEQAVLDRTSQQLARVPLEAGELARNTPQMPVVWALDDAPVAAIFDQLAAAYSIPIQFDRKLLATCSLTTTLGDEPLSEKLKLICEAVGPGTGFLFTDARVVITSKGCNL